MRTLMFFCRFLFTRWRRRKQVKRLLACRSHRLSLLRYHWYNKTFTHAYLQKELRIPCGTISRLVELTTRRSYFSSSSRLGRGFNLQPRTQNV